MAQAKTYIWVYSVLAVLYPRCTVCTQGVQSGRKEESQSQSGVLQRQRKSHCNTVSVSLSQCFSASPLISSETTHSRRASNCAANSSMDRFGAARRHPLPVPHPSPIFFRALGGRIVGRPLAPAVTDGFQRHTAAVTPARLDSEQCRSPTNPLHRNLDVAACVGGFRSPCRLLKSVSQLKLQHEMRRETTIKYVLRRRNCCISAPVTFKI